MPIIVPPPPHTLALFQEQQRLKQRQQEQALAALQEQQRLRHIALAEEQKRQQEEVLAVLQEQQRLRQIAIAEEQERQQQSLAILSQERERKEEEQFMPEGQHEVYFQDNEPLEMVAAKPNANETALTAWFTANAKFPDNNTTYQSFPTKFVYEASKRTWKERQRGTAIGRMYFASTQQGERFYLRMLLTVVTNATSWADLRTVNGNTYPTYKEACKALGLLEDDAEWRQCLAEAAPIQSESALRQLFCTILFHYAPTTPEAL
ncbi:hypothetical protein E4T56_gene16505 [Termitomyces sp. T112]|nr:hypothetical protein E4T56_gene16505 [Termitomyces sp. T112]